MCRRSLQTCKQRLIPSILSLLWLQVYWPVNFWDHFREAVWLRGNCNSSFWVCVLLFCHHRFIFRNPVKEQKWACLWPVVVMATQGKNDASGWSCTRSAVWASLGPFELSVHFLKFAFRLSWIWLGEDVSNSSWHQTYAQIFVWPKETAHFPLAGGWNGLSGSSTGWRMFLWPTSRRLLGDDRWFWYASTLDTGFLWLISRC